ncbi:MAG: hypothetical protein IKP86_00525, partial [Anaerolineaceae bacterium]|nr:hypothetical protein [Anaerolineaceae bacterium]
NDVTFIIYGWIIFDGIDLAAQYLQVRPGKIRRGFLTAVGVRFIGTLLAASSLALSNSELPKGVEAFITPHAGAYLVTACALRMGIIPVSQPYGEMSESRVGLGTMLRLVSALTVIPVLCRIPMSGMRPDLVTLLIIAGGFAALTGAVGWLLSESSFSGISYAALSVCSIAFLCALNGEQNALIVWGVSIALTCGPLSLYQIRNRFMNIVAFLGIAVFAGLPYMPNAHGWAGLIRSRHAVQNLMYILVMTLLTAGSFVHVFRTEGKKFSELEPWMRSVYPLGFFAAIGTHVFIGMTGFGEQFSLGVIPASVSVFTGGLSLALLSVYLPESIQTQNAAAWGRALLSFFWRAMRKMMDMEWLISIAERGSWALRTLALAVSEVLENNGGLIWELLLMALLIAAAFGGGQF